MSEEMIEATQSEEKVVAKKFKRPAKRKVCSFCVEHMSEIDYKDVAKLKR